MNLTTSTILAIIFWGNAFIFFYVIVVYPLVSILLARFFALPRILDEQYYPTVTLIISAYNEQQDIRQKLKNALNLSYPKEKLEIIVISDASTDDTDNIVLEFAPQGVKLHRMVQRGGKTLGLNAALPNVQSEIAVFSDANAFFENDVIQKLVRNFSDPQIGCVTGDSQYVGVRQWSAGANEKIYWDYERHLKISESRLGSMVGSDGAIFAIRTALYSPLDAQDINDFVLPLRIVALGFRCVFEQEAICEEASVSQITEEFKRKIRVVNRSWQAVRKMKSLLNPIVHGWFSVRLLSHKVLRWLTPVCLIFIFFSSLGLAFTSDFFLLFVVIQIGVYGLGCLGWTIGDFSRSNGILSVCAYFLSVNVASIVGLSKSFMGQTITVWDPIRSSSRSEDMETKSPTNRIGFVFACSVIIGGIWYAPVWSFWISVLILVHVYAGYPLVLHLIVWLKPTPWVQTSISPSVTLLVIAYNEEEVLREKLENCLALEYPKQRLSIVVCSDGSTDRTPQILGEYQDRLTIVCFPDREGKAAVIEKFFPKIQSEVIVFSDANTFFERDAIEKLVRNFADDSVGAVSGKVTLVSQSSIHGGPESMYYQYEWTLHSLESQIYSQIGVDGAMFAIRREYFPKKLRRSVNDDFYIGFQVAKNGMRVVFDPEARGQEASEVDFQSEFSRKIRIALLSIKSFLTMDLWPPITQPFLLFQLVSHKMLRWMTIFWMVIIFLSSVVLIENPFFMVFLTAQVIFYALAISGYVLQLTSGWFSIPMYFCALNLAAGIGIIKGLLVEQSGKWDRIGPRRWES